MKMEFQYFNDCPNWQITHERLLSAVEDHAGQIDIEMVQIESPDEASEIGFRGSPSIVIDGLDLFTLESRPEHGTFSCRYYGTTDGAPSVNAIADAIRELKAHQADRS